MENRLPVRVLVATKEQKSKNISLKNLHNSR